MRVRDEGRAAKGACSRYFTSGDRARRASVMVAVTRAVAVVRRERGGGLGGAKREVVSVVHIWGPQGRGEKGEGNAGARCIDENGSLVRTGWHQRPTLGQPFYCSIVRWAHDGIVIVCCHVM